MSYVPITPSRRSRKDKEVSAKKQTWVQNTMIVVIVFLLILLLSSFFQTVFAASSTIVALVTLLLFVGILTWLTTRLVMVLLTWIWGVNYGMQEVNASRAEMAGGKVVEVDRITDVPRLQTKIFRGLESLLSITAWIFFLHLLQPFIVAVLWWQGYQLIEGKSFSLASVVGTFTMLELSVYFGNFVFLVLLSWSEWNYWRHGKLNRHRVFSLV